MANYWHNFHLMIGIPTAIFAAIAGISALSKLDNNYIIAGILALLVAASTSVITFLNPKERENIHLLSGNKYNALKSKIRRFYHIEVNSETTLEKLKDMLDQYSIQKNVLNEECPIVPNRAYKKAKKAIERGEADYKIDNL